MKTEAWRRDRRSYPFQQTLQVRVSDVDTERHINNVALKGLHAEARMRYQLQAFGPEAWFGGRRLLRPTRLVTNFFAVTHYPEPVQAGLRLQGLDGDEAVFATALFQAGQCTGVQEARFGAWEDGRRVPLSATERAALAPHAHEPMDAFLPTDPVAASDDATRYGAGERIPVRYGDQDGDWRIGEVAQLRYIEQARSNVLFRALREAGLDDRATGLTMLLASKRVEFLAFHRAPEAVEARVAVGRLGGSSVDVSVLLMDGQTCIARSDGATVFADPGTNRPVPMPPPLRAALQKLALRDAVASA